jgi:hypothetical protein
MSRAATSATAARSSGPPSTWNVIGIRYDVPVALTVVK